MNNAADFASRLIWNYRFPLLAAVVSITLLAAHQMSTLTVSNSIEVWYPRDDPQLIEYREFQEAYGSDEIIVVAVTSRNGMQFSSDIGGVTVGDLTDALLDLPNVATVMSLVTVPDSLSAARGRLLSADQRTTALVVQPMIGPQAEAQRSALLSGIRALVENHDLDAHVGGYGVVFEGLNEASTSGAASLILWAHLLMVVLLALSFRRILPVAVTLFSVGAATVWTMGLYAALGHQLNMVTMVLPTLVLVIGIADCVHILRSVAMQDSGLGGDERIIRGLGAVIGPCFLATITTAAGFLGLTASGLPAVQQLGWFGAAGMVAAFACSVIVVTTGLAWRAVEPRIAPSIADRAAIALCEFGSRKATPVIAVFLLLLGVAGYGISQLSTNTESIGYLKKSHIVRQDSDFIENAFGAYVPIEFTVTSAGQIFTVENLDAIDRWQKDVLSHEKIHWSWSLVNAFGLDDDDTPSTAGIEFLASRFERMRQFSPSTIRSMMNGDREIRVSFGAPIMSSVEVKNLIREVVERARLPAGLTLKPAGYAPLYTRIIDEIVLSQVRGFGLAVILIAVLLGAGMRSWRRVLLALPANALPVALTLALMGLTGVPLDVASATIASVILGLVVDDTVHMLRPIQGAGIRQSIVIASHKAGGTLVLTTAVLAAGFLVLGLAEIRSIAWFGVLTSFAVIVAILADLLLLPAVATLFSRDQDPARPRTNAGKPLINRE